MNTLSCAAANNGLGQMETDSAPPTYGEAQITLSSVGTQSLSAPTREETIIQMEPNLLPLRPTPVYKHYCLPLCPHRVSHRGYGDVFRRLESFKGWPSQHTQTPRQMAESGFFHDPKLGDPDRVVCYYCGLTLHNWQRHEDPDKSHIAWSREQGKECCYAKINYNSKAK